MYSRKQKKRCQVRTDDGKYGIRVHIDPPEFMRHDKTNGKRYAEPVDVEFAYVEIKTGQKKS